MFSLGKVVIEENGVVNGAVIAAGRGYDENSGVEGSAAWIGEDGAPRLPRVVIHEDGTSNIDRFENWEYAALIFENGGKIVFPGGRHTNHRPDKPSG